MWCSDIFDDELFYITNKLKLIALSSKYDNDITLGLKEINDYLESKREMERKIMLEEFNKNNSLKNKNDIKKKVFKIKSKRNKKK